MSPLAEGLFHRIIALSGNAICGQYIQQKPKEATVELAKRLNCAEMGVLEMVDCLRSVPINELVVKSNDMYVSNYNLSFFFFFAYLTIYIFSTLDILQFSSLVCSCC
jgi:carboxylesterase type B